jgi:hypothetical protein
MNLSIHRCSNRREDGVALIIVLAFVVLLAGIIVAYLARTSTDRQLAHDSFNETKADQLARSALEVAVGDLKQEIVDGSTSSTVGNSTIYTPTNNANMLPMRSGTPRAGATPIPNLVRLSIRDNAPTGTNPMPTPGIPSRASFLSSAPSLSPSPVVAKKGEITNARWNKHYLIPKASTSNDQTDPVSSFIAPDWVLVTNNGPKAFSAWDSTLRDATGSSFAVGRYAYAIYDEGGLLDINVAGYPIPTPSPASSPPQPYAFKGSLAYADLTAIPTSTASPPATFPASQVNNIVGWRNYASTQPGGDFQSNFTFTTSAAQRYFNLVATNNGFLTVPTTTWSGRTDQAFLNRQQLIEYRSSTGFSANALQYLGTFSRELNSPSFSPPTPTIINPDFSQLRVTTAFTRLDGSSATVGEPLVKTRFPLSRLAWITYKGPSASLASTDPVITQLLASGVSSQIIQAGTAANIQTCFGLTYASSDLWTYSHGATDRILRLSEVASAGREPDFFELLQAAVLTGSLGQNTGGGVTGGAVFPDIHMSNTAHHILSIGAAIIDQADPDSIPTRIQFNPSGTMWTAYGIESLPYMTQIYPIAGTSPDDSTKWATYLLFQLWNPHQNIQTMPAIRLRVDGGIGIFKGGNGEVWNSATGTFYNATGQSVTLNATASFAPSPAPLLTTNSTTTGSTPGTFAAVPTSTPFVGFRLPDFSTSPVPSPSPSASPRVMLQFGATSPPSTSHPFDATMEIDVGSGVFVPYNHFIGINDSSSWINGAPVGGRDANSTGTPRAFTAAQLTQAPPSTLMKSDPRATRFGIFEITPAPSPSPPARITEPLWSSTTSLPNGWGGAIADPGGPVEHAPLRFVGNPYFPATLCINNAPSTSSRTAYTDNDGVIRPADATYPDPTASAHVSTPYFPTPTPSPTPTATPTGKDYQPIVINRPFRNVAELGYAFRDLPWKSLDFFTEASADAGLLDVFSINNEPNIVAGHVNLNTRQAPVLQSVLAGAILDELDSTNTVFKTGATATAAPVIAANIVTATTATPLRNRAELITRSGLPTSILSVPASGAARNQRVKARREVVSRAIASVCQTRTWNLIIDVIAQSGRYPPTASTLADFVVEGEKRYWLHVAIDRFTGEVVDQQLEAIYE